MALRGSSTPVSGTGGTGRNLAFSSSNWPLMFVVHRSREKEQRDADGEERERRPLRGAEAHLAEAAPGHGGRHQRYIDHVARHGRDEGRQPLTPPFVLG